MIQLIILKNKYINVIFNYMFGRQFEKYLNERRYKSNFVVKKEKAAKSLSFETISHKQFDNTDNYIVKLISNGFTGYDTYYWYITLPEKNKKQSYVIRIVKQLRKCKVTSFGNPKIIHDYLKINDVKFPTRLQSNVDIFKEILSNRISSNTANNIITWLTTNIGNTISLNDFGIYNNSSNTTSNTSDFNKLVNENTKKKVLENAIKNMLDKKSYVVIYIWDLYDQVKNASKYWKDYEYLAKDLYTNKMFSINIANYTYTLEIIRSYEGYSYVEYITYVKKACKEFESLNNYFSNILHIAPLKFEDVKYEEVEGKRSYIFGRYNTTLLAHKPEKCKKLKQFIQKTKKSNQTVVINKKHYLYTGDRYNSYGEDMESEWSGYEDNYLEIIFKTPTGKIVNSINFHVYS